MKFINVIEKNSNGLTKNISSHSNIQLSIPSRTVLSFERLDAIYHKPFIPFPAYKDGKRPFIRAYSRYRDDFGWRRFWRYISTSVPTEVH